MKQFFVSIKNRLNLQTCIEQSLLIATLLFLCLKGIDHFAYTTILLASFFYYLKTKDQSVIVVSLLFLAFLIPRYAMDQTIYEGRVIKVYSKACIVQHKNARMMLVTNEQPILDSKIAFSGQTKEMNASLGFFEFDFKSYMNHRGVYQSMYVENYKEIKPSHSLRGHVQIQINKIQNEQTRSMLQGILLHIKPKESLYRSFLDDSGFSYAGILIFVNESLKYIVSKDKRERLCNGLCLLLCIFYHFPYLLTQKLINACLKKTSWNTKERCGMGLIIGMVLYPECIDSASFLVPTVFRFVGCFSDHKKLDSYFYVLVLQSYLFHSMNPVLSLCYRQVLPLVGFSYCIAWFSLLLPMHHVKMIHVIDMILCVFKPFEMSGSIKGLGLPIFILICMFLKQRKHGRIDAIVCLIVFQFFGLFHPFATFTFVNVGQGDGMVYCGPLHKEALIFDTGKPSAYRHLSTYLDSKAIRHVDHMFISHQDLDHCGNKDELKKAYHIEHVIEEHIPKYETKTLTLYDLSTIKCEDENRSSLIHLFKFNGLKYLLMGDADYISETSIMNSYSNLHCDVLKLSHHGSNTGSCSKFLNQVKPYLAIISSGPYSLYHHPNPNVIERLNKRRIPFLDTYDEGDITIVAIGHLNVLITSSYHFALL